GAGETRQIFLPPFRALARRAIGPEPPPPHQGAGRGKLARAALIESGNRFGGQPGIDALLRELAGNREARGAAPRQAGGGLRRIGAIVEQPAFEIARDDVVDHARAGRGLGRVALAVRARDLAHQHAAEIAARAREAAEIEQRGVLERFHGRRPHRLSCSRFSRLCHASPSPCPPRFPPLIFAAVTGETSMHAPLARPVRRFGAVNWQGLWTLYLREVRRFLKVSMQTLFAPVVTTLIFLMIFLLAMNGQSRVVGNVPFLQFLAPGLVMMSITQNAFANTTSSIMIMKMQGSIVDLLMPPINAWELTWGFALGGLTRGLMVGVVVTAAM